MREAIRNPAHLLSRHYRVLGVAVFTLRALSGVGIVCISKSPDANRAIDHHNDEGWWQVDDDAKVRAEIRTRDFAVHYCVSVLLTLHKAAH